MKNSTIEWCDHTFNPWVGCTKVSPGCANCYAEARDKRFTGGAHWGKGASRQRTRGANWKQPLKWNEDAGKELSEWSGHSTLHGGNPHYPEPRRPRVFCASLADWLDDEVPIEWLADLLKLIHETPNLDWLLLTKRPELWEQRLIAARNHLTMPDMRTALWLNDWLPPQPVGSGCAKTPSGLTDKKVSPPANVWIGTTVEDQARADARIPALLKIPARVRFLSCEPLLGPVDLRFAQDEEGLRSPFPFIAPASAPTSRIHWVICGGESGRNARPMHPDWARSLRDQSAAATVPYFFKQWGEWARLPEPPHSGWTKVGKKRAGRLLDGVEHNEFPKVEGGAQ